MDDTPSRRPSDKARPVSTTTVPKGSTTTLPKGMPKFDRRWLRLGATLVAAAVMAGGAYFYWQNSVYYPSTENAYLSANIVRIAPLVTGVVSDVSVTDNQPVKAGDVLFKIDPAPFQAALDAAQARLDLAQTQQKAAQGAQAIAAKSNTDQAQAAVTKAKTELDYATVKAPVAGIVGTVRIRPGSLAQAGFSLFPLVDTSTWWVDANFKETELPRIAVGQPATVTLDLTPSKELKGKVESISPASSTAFSLLPAENASGNWVKVPQRFAVRISLDTPPADLPMRVGASASVTVDTTKGSDGGKP